MKQAAHTTDLIFSVAEVASYLNQMMTLHPGDIISTGAPAGVGIGMKPQRFLGAGDTDELSVDGLGAQSQIVESD